MSELFFITHRLKAEQLFADDCFDFLKNRFALFYNSSSKLVDWRFVNLPFTSGKFLVLKIELEVPFPPSYTYRWFHVVDNGDCRKAELCHYLEQYFLNDSIFLTAEDL